MMALLLLAALIACPARGDSGRGLLPPDSRGVQAMRIEAGRPWHVRIAARTGHVGRRVRVSIVPPPDWDRSVGLVTVDGLPSRLDPTGSYYVLHRNYSEAGTKRIRIEVRSRPGAIPASLGVFQAALLESERFQLESEELGRRLASVSRDDLRVVIDAVVAHGDVRLGRVLASLVARRDLEFYERAWAAMAIAELQDGSSWRSISELLSSPNPGLRAVARSSLCQLVPWEVRASLTETLLDDVETGVEWLERAGLERMSR